MANIESKLTTIRSAAGGEDVRDAIIGALRDINNDVPADMSNPVQIVEDMPQGTDLTIPLNPPKLVSQILIKQAGSGGKSTTLNDITITENGEYPTDDEGYDPNKENRYYSKVTVKVPQLANAVLDLEEEITQNGTYSAPADWGVDGLRTFTVNVSGASGDGPFQVEFYDKPQTDPTAAVMETQLVPNGGSAQPVKTQPTSDIGVFTGWNPSPNHVTRDMKCYPKFGQIIIDPTDIADSWEVICQRGGAGYPLGSHAPLAYGATFTADEIKTINPGYAGGDVALNILMEMYKVGEGEGTSHSSWMSSAISIGNWPVWLGEYTPSFYWANNSRIRQFLNGIFFSHMSNIFKSSIVPVSKYSLNNDGIMVPTTDSVWIPGTSEVGTDNTIAEGSSTYDFQNNPAYLPNIERLDAVSTKYVRDYLNNDRTYDIWFLSNHLQESITGKIFALRDHATNGNIHGYQRWNYDGYPIAYATGGTPEYINIGFCL